MVLPSVTMGEPKRQNLEEYAIKDHVLGLASKEQVRRGKTLRSPVMVCPVGKGSRLSCFLPGVTTNAEEQLSHRETLLTPRQSEEA